MLYVPFRSLDDLADFYQFLDPPIPQEAFNPDDNNDLRWRTRFYYRMLRTPTLFSQDIQRLFHGIEEGDFHLNVNPFDDSDDEWDSIPLFPR